MVNGELWEIVESQFPSGIVHRISYLISNNFPF